ncbi:hypothetical protein C8K30_11071 [Promicromonospora sp. AC04]|uniref:T6SS immunity protein Tdi1 domain-containing protein n=1 Tax=Promicromonospora sp. AC04 TaxID=2135723 RepID=UPI000D43A1B4|nr:T6SS immunity protein Tdi1 domain-containing protein [Promicromonospora sp. AC04]PUB23931.1 hypothetical protein C8K30_11071 [Promicromonospora sp. AC04]
MKLLRTFPKVAFEFGLASWQWLGLREQTPRFATCFGDIFLESLDGWWFLDTVEGTLELRWTSAVTMYEELESPDGRATYLMDDLVRDARSRGIRLTEEDVYTFNPHPALGGELGVNGLGTMRFELALNWVGQMHDRVLHSSGEISLPPLPDGGRRAAPPVVESWDPAWSEDETFDVPFEQYLATTTFAAVAAPQRNDDGFPSLPPSPGREHEGFGQVPYAAQNYAAQGYDALGFDVPGGGAPSYETPAAPAQPWSGQNAAAPLWSGQTESAQPWLEPYQAAQPATPDEGYDAPHDSYPAAPEQPSEQYGTGAADQQSGGTAEQNWAPYSPGQDQHGQSAPVWDAPTWGRPAPPAAAGGGQKQTPPTNDPFTAWDDLWGKR